MKIVIAPDSFKHALSATEASAAIAAGVSRVWPHAHIRQIPMADGGEGTVDALVNAAKGQYRTIEVVGPLGLPVQATYGMLPADRTAPDAAPTAVIEMAAAAGLPLVPPKSRNPLHTTTFGLGQLIMDALDQHCGQCIIGLGGSATNDCGAGMAQALGVRFLDAHDRPITEHLTGQRIAHVARIDLAGLDPRLHDTRFTVACDVQNPLLGPNGAAAVYARQKGAPSHDLPVLEANVQHLIDLIEETTAQSVRNTPGAGAAGGLGAALLAFLHADLQKGIDIVLSHSRFHQHMTDADLIITAEGRIDGQTLYGKTIAGIAHAAAPRHIPVIALAGALGPDYQKTFDLPLAALLPIAPGPITLNDAIANAAQLLADAAQHACRLIDIPLSHNINLDANC